MISHDELLSVLDYNQETGLFTWKIGRGRVKQGCVAGARVGNRIEIRINGKRYKAHRLAWLYVHGAWPVGEIDHKDRNPSNNAISNLRDVTHKQNLENTGLRVNNTSGFKGVSWNKKDRRWQAKIQHFGTTFFLGNYCNPKEASLAYETVRAQMFSKMQQNLQHSVSTLIYSYQSQPNTR